MNQRQLLVLSALTILVYTSCNFSRQTNKNQTPPEPRKRSFTSVENDTREKVPELLCDSSEAATFLFIDSSKLSILHSFKFNSRNYFIISNVQANESEVYFHPVAEYGLMNDSGRIILPVRYDVVHNPGGVFPHLVEFKLGEKYGLLNLNNENNLQASYQFFLPTLSELSFFGYNEQGWQAFFPDLLPKEGYHYKLIRDAISAYSFNPKEEKASNLEVDIYDTSKKLTDYICVIPSAIKYLFSSKYDYWELPKENEEWEYGGLHDLRLQAESKNLENGLVAYLAKIQEEFIDGRGYTVTQEQLLVADSQGQTIHKQHIQESIYSAYLCSQEGITFLQDTLLEIREVKLETELYDYELCRRYLQIGSDGRITPLINNRHFSFTKFIKLDSSFFTGCFAKKDKELEEWERYETQHLSIRDLDIMRNEIFADYGYKFKSPVWADYFNQKSWYKPNTNNVSDLLTEIDRYNIQYILELKKRMQANLDKYLSKEKTMENVSG